MKRYFAAEYKRTTRDTKTKQLIILYYEIRRLRNIEHFSIQRIVDHFSSVVHARLKEHYACFPTVDPKTVYNYVIHLRNELNMHKISSLESQYSLLPDVQPSNQAQVDFDEKS